MATIEFIEKRITGKEKELEKLQKKLERIYKAKESDWEVNPYYYNEDDIKWTQRDIEQTTTMLDKYREDLKIATQKANSRNVKVIIEFLETWKVKTKAYYMNNVDRYNKARKEMSEANSEYIDWWTFKRGEATKEEIKRRDKENRELKKEFKEAWGWLMVYMERGKINEEKLDRDIKIEAERKYDFIIERTNAIVGTITDASNLYIGLDGDLNGYIIGENGKAKVQTIGAGGWNIQRFHFRTLIHEMK